MTIVQRVEKVRGLVRDAAARAGRDAASVTIVAVSKSVERAVVDEAYALGLRHFGENRVQSASAKFASPLPADATLHLIGQLQTNKARPAVSLFGLVESVDRLSLVEALDREAARLGRRLPVLLQVNVAGEVQKAGCTPGEAPDLARQISARSHLELRGLMTIAPLVADAEATRPVFRALREVRDRLVAAGDAPRLDLLSMGMSNDFAVAIEEGATHVRIGRAIFGR